MAPAPAGDRIQPCDLRFQAISRWGAGAKDHQLRSGKGRRLAQRPEMILQGLRFRVLGGLPGIILTIPVPKQFSGVKRERTLLGAMPSSVAAFAGNASPQAVPRRRTNNGRILYARHAHGGKSDGLNPEPPHPAGTQQAESSDHPVDFRLPPMEMPWPRSAWHP